MGARVPNSGDTPRCCRHRVSPDRADLTSLPETEALETVAFDRRIISWDWASHRGGATRCRSDRPPRQRVIVTGYQATYKARLLKRAKSSQTDGKSIRQESPLDTGPPGADDHPKPTGWETAHGERAQTNRTMSPWLVVYVTKLPSSCSLRMQGLVAVSRVVQRPVPPPPGSPKVGPGRSHNKGSRRTDTSSLMSATVTHSSSFLKLRRHLLAVALTRTCGRVRHHCARRCTFPSASPPSPLMRPRRSDQKNDQSPADQAQASSISTEQGQAGQRTSKCWRSRAQTRRVTTPDGPAKQYRCGARSRRTVTAAGLRADAMQIQRLQPHAPSAPTRCPSSSRCRRSPTASRPQATQCNT